MTLVQAVRGRRARVGRRQLLMTSILRRAGSAYRALAAGAIALALAGAPSLCRAQTFSSLYSFSGSDGAVPVAGLIRASDGNLYGTTINGGAHGYGTVFQISTAGTLTVLHSFSGADGANPFEGLVQASDGNLYGTSTQGGASNVGTVFRISTGGTLTVLHNFSGSDGAGPSGALIQASDGNLYGTTVDGGIAWDPSGNNYGQGTIFKLTLPLNDVTGQTSVVRGGFARYPFSKTIVQKLTLTNNGPDLTGPVYLALDNLTSGVTLSNSTGTTVNYSPTGSPYITVSTTGMAAGSSTAVFLRFNDPALVAINYTTRVLNGPGHP